MNLDHVLLTSVCCLFAACTSAVPPRTASDMRHMERQQSVGLHTSGDNSVSYVDPSDRPSLVVRPGDDGVDAAVYGPDPVSSNSTRLPERRFELNPELDLTPEDEEQAPPSETNERATE